MLAGERHVLRVLGGLAGGLGRGRRLARGLVRPPRVLLARGALDRALVVPLLVDEPLHLCGRELLIRKLGLSDATNDAEKGTAPT